MRVRRRRGLHRRHTRSDSVCAQRFCTIRHGEVLTVEHDIGPDELCDDLAVKLAESKEELFNLRFQKATGQLEKTGRVKEVRRDIARIKTIAAQKAAKKV